MLFNEELLKKVEEFEEKAINDEALKAGNIALLKEKEEKNAELEEKAIKAAKQGKIEKLGVIKKEIDETAFQIKYLKEAIKEAEENFVSSYSNEELKELWQEFAKIYNTESEKEEKEFEEIRGIIREKYIKALENMDEIMQVRERIKALYISSESIAEKRIRNHEFERILLIPYCDQVFNMNNIFGSNYDDIVDARNIIAQYGNAERKLKEYKYEKR